MYGIGFCSTAHTGISFTGQSNWGMYVAADGDARVWLDGSAGVVTSTGQHYVGSNVVWNAGNDGSGSGLDADLLDGVHGASFLRSDTADTASGVISFTAGHGALTITNSSIMSAASSNWTGNPGANGKIQYHSNRWYIVSDSSSNRIVQFRRDGADKSYIDNNGALIGGGNWYSGNDGSGSGLDADLLDGVQGASYLRSDAADTASSKITFSTGLARSNHHVGHLEGSYNNVAANSNKTNPIYTIGSAYNPSTTSVSGMYGIGYAHSNLWGTSSGRPSGWGQYVVEAGAYTQIFSVGGTWSLGQFNRNGNTVWDAGNDGSGSGLDADLLDGLQLHTGRNNAANRVVRTDGNGYIQAGWINTTSGDSGLANDVVRIYCSNDAYLRYLGKSDFKVLMGLSKDTYDRRDYTSDARYHTGVNAHGAYNMNDLFARGSGFIDVWSSPTGRPPSGTHFNGFQALHFSGSNTYHHGMQLVMSAGNPSNTYLRGWWANGGSGYAWQKIWTDGNDGSGSGLDADLLDGMNAGSSGGSIIMKTESNGYSQLQNWTNVAGTGLYSSTTNSAHWYPHTATSYGTWRIDGSRNGYSGIYLHNGGAVVIGMYDSAGNGGDYHQASGKWSHYWHRGNTCLGINNSTTSSSYSLYVTGAIYATSNITAYSDRRVKENIVQIDGALEKVNKLTGVYYNKIDDEKKNKEIGFIAQDVNEVVPELVTYAEDVDQYGVKYGNTTALLVEAVKELTQQVKDLKQEIDKMKEKQ